MITNLTIFLYYRFIFLYIKLSKLFRFSKIAKLKKKNVIFVPTPGQPEQEYLAWKFKSEGIAHSVEQRDLAIEKDMKLARGFKGFSFSSSNDLLIKAIEKLTS